MIGMEKWIGKVALVTGASSGIGRAVCQDLVKQGVKVVGVARREDRLKTLEEELSSEKGTFVGMKCDLTKDDEILGVFKAVKSKFGGVDVCVNNAGMFFNNSLLDGNPSEWRHMMETNVIALCLCAKETYTSLVERNQDMGHIINVSSLGSHMVLPVSNFHFYMGTKFAVRAITEGLRQELREKKSPIRISSISPGAVKTEIIQAAKVDQQIVENIFTADILQPEDISSLILQMLASPPHVEVNDIIVRPTTQAL